VAFVEVGERIGIIGALVNLGLSGLKFTVGALVGSVALVADGLHSLSDLLTDLVVVVGMRLGRRPPDATHPYGHGKFETLAGSLVSLVLIGVGAEIGLRSFAALRGPRGADLAPAMMAVALASLGIKEILYHATAKAASAVKSPALWANAWHHRSDALSSLAVLFGGVASALGYPAGDGVTGMAVAAVILASGGKLLWDSFYELVEGRLNLRRMLSSEPSKASRVSWGGITCAADVPAAWRLWTFISLWIRKSPCGMLTRSPPRWSGP